MQSSESVSPHTSLQPAEPESFHGIEAMNGASQLALVDKSQRKHLWGEQREWLHYFHRCSRLLVAVIELNSLRLRYANEFFCRLTGMAVEKLTMPQDGILDVGTALEQLLSTADHALVVRLYRKHLLHRVLQNFYQIDARGCRLLDEPVLVTLHSPLYDEPRYVEFWLRSEQLTLTRINPEVDEFAEFGLSALSSAALETQLANVDYLRKLIDRLQVENYHVEGCLLLEGADMTEPAIIRRITQLLIDQDSILQTEKFRVVDQQMRSLFRAQNTVVVSIDGDQTRLFTGSVNEELDNATYPLETLRNSHMLHAIQTNQVATVPDLMQDCRNDFGQQLIDLGIRSLLYIPLVRQPDPSKPGLAEAQPVGLVGIMSDRPHNFDGLDCRYAEQLIPAFTAALTAAQRQLVQRRFITNIHPSVEWRFLQEAERRSLGLPPEPIVFEDVYPLYGISDIRGSSEERNRAIQADLLAQFNLGLAVIEAARASQPDALIEQLRLDLLEQIQQLEQKVTVDAEVSLLRYLRDNLEAYFEYFAQAGVAAVSAIAAYHNACNNDHHCVYHARASYDEMVGKINSLLRETWDRWQTKMQQISPHYCDIESTDGIDHMIYAGKSIDPRFGSFQLRSLRYEQLRAVCDCARTALRLQTDYDTRMQVTHLVLVQDATVDIFHDETTERLFDVRGTHDTRYEIVKKRIDKALDAETQTRITQPGALTLVYSTDEEWSEYQHYLRYLSREGWLEETIDRGLVEPLQGVNGLRYARTKVLSPEKVIENGC
jgi:hypothetical protein